MRKKKNSVRRSLVDVCPVRSDGLHVVSSKTACSWIGTKADTYCELGSIHFATGNSHTAVAFPANGRLWLSHCSACNCLVVSKKCFKKEPDEECQSFAVKVDAIQNAKELELIPNLSHTSRTFEVVVSLKEGALSLAVYVKKSAISSASVYSSHSDEMTECIISVVSFFFSCQVTPGPRSRKHKVNLMKFYRAVERVRVPCPRYRIDTSNIIPALRRYQEDAVHFMISRELDPSISLPFSEFLVHLPTNPPLWFCKATGGMSDIPFPAFSFPPGGILADEMGLGKTVEFLALVLSHKREGIVCLDEEDRKTPDEVHVILNELVSSVVVAVEAPSSLAWQGKARNMIYYNQEVPAKKTKRMPAVPYLPVTVSCVKCGLVCPQERVHWNRFLSSKIAFRCPDCIQEEVEKGNILPIKATLIIVPSMISLQWYEEVKRHTRDVTVDIYRGVVAEGYKHPEYLALKDIVICSLETLRNEVYFVDAHNKNTAILRRPKRVRIAPTPLLAVQWWRLCVDEAQLVENSKLVVSNMCRRIHAVNRWCVTGTPIKTSINDLYGLFAFLGIEPICHYGWWTRFILDAYLAGDTSPLIQLVSQVFWRSSKKRVMDQIGLSQLTNEVTMLRFTPVEDQLYRDRLAVRRNRQLMFLEDRGFERDMLLTDMPGSDFEQFMTQLNDVRSSIILPVAALPKRPEKLTSEQGMHEELSMRTISAIENHQREILLCCNGLSGIGWLTDDLEFAARYYELAVSSMRLLDTTNERLNLTERRGPFRKLRSDALQQIHTMTGIIDLFNRGIDVKNIDLETARTKMKEAEDHYTSVDACSVRAAVGCLSTVLENLRRNNFAKESRVVVGWLCDAADALEAACLQHVLIDAICNAFLNNDRSDIPVHSLRGLNFVLVSRWDELTNCVADAIRFTETILSGELSDETSVINDILACHYESPSQPLCKCVLCVYDRKLKRLESLLFFGAPTKKDSDVELGTAGRKKVSSMEIAMRVVRNLITRMPAIFAREVAQLADDTLSLIDCFKEFLSGGKQCFMGYSNYADRRHEIEQCKIRLEYLELEAVDAERENFAEVATSNFYILRGSSSEGFVIRGPVSDRYIVHGQEEQRRNRYIVSLKDEELKQTRLLGKLRYITNLRQERKMVCPVCLSPMEGGWMVLACAHCLCFLCYRRIASGRFGQARAPDVRCPVCRETTPKNSAREVQLAGPTNQLHHLDSPNVKLTYGISVKLDAVVIRLLSIKERNPFAKTIVFTSFQQIISTLCSMISDHDIPCRCLSQSNRQKILAEFRQDERILVLLMPINLGARGLNLTVANNIIFVEPQMDASQLAQAIGRIDRIGQTRNMTIHHFVVRDTIEEQIYHSVCDLQTKKWTVGSVVDMLNYIDASTAR